MLLYNEQQQQVNPDELKQRILNQLGKVAVPTDDEITSALGGYYQQATKLEYKSYNMQPVSLLSASTSTAIAPAVIGGSILDKIKKFICGFLNQNATTSEIIDAILKAIASIIPGGVIVENFIQMLVKYIVNKGITAFCSIS